MNNRKWTKEEEQYLFSQLKKNPTNMEETFALVAARLDRTSAACKYRWYSVIKRSTEYGPCFFTIGSEKSLVNGKVTANNLCIIDSSESIFSRILRFLHIK